MAPSTTIYRFMDVVSEVGPSIDGVCRWASELELVTRSWRPGAGDLELATWSWRPGAGDQELVTWSWRPGAGDLELMTLELVT